MAYSTKTAQAFSNILEKEKDWEKRVIAMGKMEETLKTDFGLDLTTKDILLFRPALCAQISDNRTSVTKQACDLVSTLAETHSTGFAAHTQVIVSVLLKQTTVTVKVASDAAHVALCLMLRVQALPAGKIYLEIVKGLKDVHNSTLRRRCSLYLLILVKFRFNGLKAMLDEFPALLISLLRDSSATTRTRARAIFVHLSAASPNHANLVLQEVDAKVKLTLTEEITLETADMDGFEPTPPASTAGSRAGSRVGSRTTSRSTSRSASRSTSPERAKSSSSALNSTSGGGGLDLSSLERKLASLSARSPVSSPVPSVGSPSSPSTSSIPRTPSSITSSSKSFIRSSPSATPTKPATLKEKTTSTASKPASATSKTKITSTTPTSTVTKTSTGTKTTTTTAKRTAISGVSSSEEYTEGPTPSQADIDIVASFQSAEGDGGLKFNGDWRLALKDLRSLIRRTRTFLELEAPEELGDLSYSSGTTATEALASAELTSSAASITSNTTTDTASTASRIPLSPRSITQQSVDSSSAEVVEVSETTNSTDDLEEGWNEVEDPDYPLPDENEESVVV